MAETAERQLKRWLKDVENAADKFNKRDRKKVLRAGANPVRETARRLTPVRASKSGRTDLNPRYKYRGKGAKRAKRGKGKIVAYYVPGNLSKSVQTLNFRRSSDVFVGPRYTRKKLPVYGRTVSRADGYYAAMLYGSASRFRQRILIPALRQNASEVRRVVLTKARELIIQYSGKGA